jgi:hypothetical protein
VSRVTRATFTSAARQRQPEVRMQHILFSRCWKFRTKARTVVFFRKNSSFADPGCLSRIRIFWITDPNFFHPGSDFFPSRIGIKELKYFNPKKWFIISRKYDPGCFSRIRIPDPDFLLIPDPGSGGQRGTGSRIRMRNTEIFKKSFVFAKTATSTNFFFWHENDCLTKLRAFRVDN